MTAVLSRIINWTNEIVWNAAIAVGGPSEPAGTVIAEIDDPALVEHLLELNAVAYRSGYWKITRYDRGNKELLRFGHERDQHNAIRSATDVLAEMLSEREK